MTDQLTRRVRAGWYEDPDDTTQVRWWNGLGWTDHVADKPEYTAGEQAAQQEDVDAPAVAESRDTRDSTSEQH